MKIAPAILALCILSRGFSGTMTSVVEGNPSSPVKVVIYEDLQCGDCQNFRTMMDLKILPRYGTRVAFVHRDFPLGRHDWARQAAIAARWVYEQSSDLGITFRREIMSEQDHMTPEKLKPWLLEFAARNHLDQKGILDSLSDPRLISIVDQDYQAAVARGITHTPTVCVEGQTMVETIVYEDLATVLDHALAR
jgi:protein-disulfide isomerase